MNLDVLKTYCDLVDTGSFSKAAEANYVSQSAVSQQLAKIEQELSTQLINRGRGLVAPTEAGKAFYNGAREILRRYEQLQGEVRSAADAVRGVLRVGTIYSVGFYLLESYVRKFLQEHPEVDLHVEYTAWNRIYSAVVNGEMDLGVVACPEKHRSIEIINMADEELAVICSPENPLAVKKSLRPADLEGQKIVAFMENIPTRRFIDGLLKADRVQVKVAMEFDNTELLKRAVEVNAGIGILPKENVINEVKFGTLVCIPFARPVRWSRKVAVIRRRGKTPGPAERMFLDLLRQAGKEKAQQKK